MIKEKESKYRLLTIKEASICYNVPEQTLRSWWREEHNREWQKLFKQIKGTGRIFVDADEFEDALESDLEERLEIAEDGI